jgi:hypothetical protein
MSLFKRKAASYATCNQSLLKWQADIDVSPVKPVVVVEAG